MHKTNLIHLLVQNKHNKTILFTTRYKNPTTTEQPVINNLHNLLITL